MKKSEAVHILSVAFFLSLAVFGITGYAIAAEGDALDYYPYQHILANKQLATAVAVDPDGYIIIAGSTQNATEDFFVLKVMADGSDELWSATYDMNGGIDRVTAVAVAVDSNHDVIVTGFASNGVDNDIHTIKYSAAGAVLWQATYNGASSGDDIPFAIAIDSLNNTYIAGKTQSSGGTDDGLLLKYSSDGANPNGTPIWVQTYDGPGTDRNDEWAAVAVSSAGVVVTGKTDIGIDAEEPNFNLVTKLYNLDGSYNDWAGGAKLYASGSQEDTGKYVALDSNDNVIVSAFLSSNSGDIYTVKYNSVDGSIDWEVPVYDGGAHDEPMGLVVDNNDDVYITGQTYTNSSINYYTVRYNGSTGNMAWGAASIYDSGSDQTDIPVDIVVDNAGDVFVTGYTVISPTDSDFTTIKYGKETGSALWTSPTGVYNGTDGKTDQPLGLGLSDSGELFVGGWTNTAANDYDFVAIKYDPGNLNGPTSLTATTVSATAIDLSWTIESGGDEDGFNIFRKKASDQNFVQIGMVGTGVNTYSDEDPPLTEHIWYEYKVQAYKIDPVAVSHFSNEASALTTLISYIPPSSSYLYDSIGNGEDYAYDIAVGPDEDPVATGSHQPGVVSDDYYTVKMHRGDLSKDWDATYNDSSDKLNVANCVTIDTNNDVIISGVSNLSWLGAPNTNDIYTRKYLSTGPAAYPNLYVWSDQYNGPGGDDDRSESIDSSVDGDNNTVVTGYGKNEDFNDDIYVVKYDAPGDGAGAGIRLWTATPYDGGGNDYPAAVVFDMNGDVIVVGKTYLSGNYDVFTRKINGSTGATIWTATWDGAGNGWDEARGMALDSNGDVYVVASSINASGDDDWVILKYDGDASGPNGAVLAGWPIIHDGPANGDDIPEAIKVDRNDDAVVVAGTVLQSAGNNDFHLRRYLADGTLDWARTLERPSNYDNATTMGMDVSGNVCVAGNTDDPNDPVDPDSIDLLAIKYDYAGNILGGTLFDDVDDSDAHAIAVNTSGDQFIAGYTTPRLNLDADFLVVTCEGEVLQSPSPFSATVHYTSVDLNWVSSNTPDEDGFYLERKIGACAGVDWTTGENQIYSGAAGSESYIDEGLNIGSTYCYRLQAYKSSGATSRWLEKEVTTTTPTPPSDLVAEVVNTTDIKLNWTDTTTTETGFRVVRCTGAGCDLNDLGDPTRTTFDVDAGVNTFTDTTGCPGETYSYQIQAYRDTIGNWETAFVNFTADLPTAGLAPPTALIKTDFAQTTVSLEWNDNSNDETFYHIERCTGTAAACDDSDFSDIGTVTSIYGNVMLLGMNEVSWNATPNQVLDDSGNDNHATSAGDANTGTDGIHDRRGELDGSGDYLTTSLEIDQSATSAGATMMAWVYPSTTSAGNHYLFSTENGSVGPENFNWGLLRNGATWYVDTGSGVTSTGIAVTEDQWQHIAVVFDPAGIRFYKNGIETAMAAPGNNDTSQAFTIGRRGILDQEYFDGYLDEVAVYDRPLTEVQVQTLMNDSVFEYDKARYADSTISYNEVYTYQVRAEKTVDPACTWDPAKTNELEVSTLPPPPTDFVATAVDSTRVIVDWTDNTADEDNFTLERCETASCTYADVTTTIAADAETYTDDSACGGTTYNYRIKGTDAVWTATLPSTVSETTTGPEGIDPTGLIVTDIWEEQAELEWNYLATDLTELKVGACDASGTCAAEGDYTVTTVSSSPLSGDILARWQFDEPDWQDGRPVLDSSGNGYHATAKNEVALVTPGKFGYGAGEFDGNDDYLSTPLNIDQSNSSSRITMEAWVFPTSTSSTPMRVISTENADNAYNWGFYQMGSYWYFNAGNTNNRSFGAVTLNDWNHLVVTYNPADPTEIRAYKNGVQTGTYSAIGYTTSDANVTIGRRAYADDQYFTGKIDEVIIYNRVLSPDEIMDRALNRTRHTVTGLTPNTLYNFRVWPYKNSTCAWADPFTNTFTEVTEFTDDIEATPPSNFNFTSSYVDTTQADFTWDDIASSETGYRVQRCLGDEATCTSSFVVDGAGAADWLLEASTTSYSDTTACNGLTYTYRVRAEKNDGPIWNSTWAYYEITTASAVAPGLNLTMVSESEVNITWDDFTPDEEQFILARCEGDQAVCDGSPPEEFEEVATVAGSALGFPSLHYRMDEDSWTDATPDVIDISRNDLHGQSYNGLTTVEAGKYDRAGHFDGIDDYISTPLNIDQSADSAGVTFEAWVNPEVNSDTYLFSTDNGGYDWGVLWNGTYWWVTTGTSYAVRMTTTPLSGWQHIAAVFIPGEGIRFYRNGIESFTSDIGYDTSDSNVTIGRHGTSNYRWFKGSIDEAIIYERTLTQEEITEHYNNQVDKYEFADSGLDPGTFYTYRIQAEKTASSCSWTVETIDTVKTDDPPAPEDFAVGGDTTTAALTWTNLSGSATNYHVQRCTGDCDSGGTWGTLDSTLAGDAESYDDTTVCPGQTFSYRVRAENPAWGGGGTAWVSTVSPGILIPTPTTPSDLNFDKVSEVQVNLSWTDINTDESGFTIEQCAVASCKALPVDPGASSYQAINLTPDTNYTFRIRADKASATCGWPTAYTDVVSTDTFAKVPGTLGGAAADTKSIDLIWTDNTGSETGTEIWRCTVGVTCDTYEKVGTAGPGAESFTDTTACYGQQYKYQVKAIGEGLSRSGGGDWTKKAPITFVSGGGFKAHTAVELVIPYATYSADMQADFRDIRFFDATAKQELTTYWFAGKVDGISARVWFMTGDNDNIYLYYGNALATDSSGTDAPFIEVYDDFTVGGGDPDPNKWVEIDPTSKISQSGGDLNFAYGDDSWTRAVISTKTFERAVGNEVIFDLSTLNDSRSHIVFGWEKDQTASPAFNQMMHGIRFYGQQERTSHFEVVENGVGQAPPASERKYFKENTDYQIKTVLKDVGAEYYLLGGLYPDWTLIHETSSNSDPILRLGILHYYLSMKVHSVTVKHASAQRGATIGTISDVGTDEEEFNIWESLYNDNGPVTISTDNFSDPNTLILVEVSDTSVDLSWNSTTTDESGFKLERCVDTGEGCTFVQFDITGAGVTTYSDTNVPASATVSYRVKAYKTTADCDWTSGPSNALSVDLAPASPTGPDDVGFLAAMALNSFKIKLDWVDNSSDEDGYEIEVQVFNGAYTRIATLAADLETYTDTSGIDPGTTYNYRVRSYRGAVKSSWLTGSATTPAWSEGASTCP